MKIGRILYIAGETAQEYRWQHRQLSMRRYDNLQAGLLQQELDDHPDSTLLLLDLPALEFRADSLPAVRGEDLRQMRARRLERLFPGSAFCNAQLIEADPQDAQRNLWLFHGLALQEAIEPWLSTVRASASPLAGISALPLFTTRALQDLGHRPEQLLWVAGTPSGWRFLYFHGGQLLFSRVLPYLGSRAGNVTAGATEEETLEEEVERTRQYLVAQRWLAHNEMLHVWLTPMVSRPTRPWSPLLNDAGGRSVLSVSTWTLAQLFPQSEAEVPHADGLHDWIASQLLRHWPAQNHYAPADLRQRFLGRTLRRAAWVGGALILLAGAVLASFDLLEAQGLQQQIDVAQQQIAASRQQLAQVLQGLPAAALPLPELEARMQALRAIQMQHAPLRQWLLPISQALSAQPIIELRSLEWSPVKTAQAGWRLAFEARVESDDARQVASEIAQLQQRLVQSGFAVNVTHSPLNYDAKGALREQLQRADAAAPLRVHLTNSDFSMELIAPGGGT
ncbi:MAG: hypothetical protein EPO06_04410 [Burkholderiaceae bacterium]|nr:MAG: hypothetical protein EPO06_04410 [Burkholderiaceae bacterium]